METGVELASTLDLQRVLDIALRKAEEVCRAETSSIWEVDEDRQELFFRIVRGAFHMRRKQLYNTLEAALDEPKARIERLCRHARIDPHRRGETLGLEEFARLARAAADYGSTNL
jgi:16S rRNA A1518/A1519 N6-dimethyltransferase RsmA/KsgA/DIM1 with predicted DNA glycosylase/AP lyase activity